MHVYWKNIISNKYRRKDLPELDNVISSCVFVNKLQACTH